MKFDFYVRQKRAITRVTGQIELYGNWLGQIPDNTRLRWAWVRYLQLVERKIRIEAMMSPFTAYVGGPMPFQNRR